MNRQQLMTILGKNSMTIDQIENLLKEHDSHLVSHELLLESFASFPRYINLILCHYKKTPKGSIDLYKSEPILGEWTEEDKQVKLATFPLVLLKK